MTPEISALLAQLRESLAIPTVGQSDGMCGPASLKAALQFYGVEVPEPVLKRLSDATTKDGASPQGLAQAAIELGHGEHDAPVGGRHPPPLNPLEAEGLHDAAGDVARSVFAVIESIDELLEDAVELVLAKAA